jgi:hypothetical protein
MLPMESRVRRHTGLRRKRNARLGAVRSWLVRVWRVRRLMLRICRLGRRHAVLVHGRPTIVTGAAGAVRHQRVRGSRARASRRGGMKHSGRGVAPIVRIADTWRRLRSLRRLLRLLRRGWRWGSGVVCWRRRGGSSPVLVGHPVGLLVWSHLLLRLRAGRPLTGRRLASKRLTLGSVRIPRLRGRIDIRDPTSPRALTRAWRAAVQHRLRRLRRRRPGARASPLRSRRANGASSLVSLRVNIGGLSRRGAASLPAMKQLQPGLDVRVRRVELSGAGVRIEGIGRLVIARLVLRDPG